MEVQPDIIMNEGEEHEEHFDSIVEEEAVDPIQGTSQSKQNNFSKRDTRDVTSSVDDVGSHQTSNSKIGREKTVKRGFYHYTMFCGNKSKLLRRIL